jgi:hypothetical protein
MIRELRLLLSEMILSWAYSVMPESKEKEKLAILIIGYFKGVRL